MAAVRAAKRARDWKSIRASDRIRENEARSEKDRVSRTLQVPRLQTRHVSKRRIEMAGHLSANGATVGPSCVISTCRAGMQTSGGD